MRLGLVFGMADETSEKVRAPIHERVRRQHSSELAQDYVEAIYEIEGEGDAVAISSLQQVFGVSHVTVIRTLQRLQGQGLVTSTKSKEIGLTEKGKTLAREAARRHHLVKALFVRLGVEREQADADAEGAEHHLSQETLDAIATFLDEGD